MPVNLSVAAADQIFPVAGVTLASTAAGLKSNGQSDMVLVAFPPNSHTAAVFTRNSYCAAPVTVCRDHVNQLQVNAAGEVRALIINSGGANAATGSEGERIARQSCRWVAEALGVDERSVLVFSTGVIGEQLPEKKLQSGIATLHPLLAADNWLGAASGIMTTDILPKLVSRKVKLPSGEITLNGIAKGSGMIQPNMATMLAFMATDASVPHSQLQPLLSEITDRTFNSVTVDGDTSTNDSLTLTTTGESGVHLSREHADWPQFVQAVHDLALTLAQSIVRDGEGATKFITINVTGGLDDEECKTVGLTVGNSPLVKTAFFASDANLGRIVMAVGRARPDLDLNTLSLHLDEVEVMIKGQPSANYTEEQGQRVMQQEEISINIDLGRGSADWSVWTCDMSHEYVTINSDYRS